MGTQRLIELKEAWTLLFPSVQSPADSQWALWLFRHGFETTREALIQLGEKYMKSGGQMTPEYMAKFLSAVANRLSAETRAEGVAYLGTMGTTARR
jgi:hypothetical protein